MTFDLGVIKRQRYTSPTYSAIGGTISYYTSGGVAYTVHSFLSTYASSLLTIFAPIQADILLVGGGQGGNTSYGGQNYGPGGGAGQVRTTSTTLLSGQYIVTIGAGGASGLGVGGASSIVGSTISYATTATGGSGSTGLGASGAYGTSSDPTGGNGITNDYLNGSATYYGGGGGGVVGSYGGARSGGLGGGGNGGGAPGPANPTSGTGGTGGGGGGANDPNVNGTVYGGFGGSGIIVIRYPTPVVSLVPLNDPYFNYVSLLLSNQTTNVTTPTPIYSNAIPRVEYIAVAGGGAAGQMQGGGNAYHFGGGGGAGGAVIGTLTNVLLSSSNIFVITVGAGGTGSLTQGSGNGQNSSMVNRSIWNFTTASIIAYGGGQGGQGASSNNPSATVGLPGGSGGGGGGDYGGGGVSGGATTQSSLVDVSKGNAGGAGGGRGATFNYAIGGGGAGAGGTGQAGATDSGGAGGAGYVWLNGSTYAAGGASNGAGVPGTAYTGNGGNGNSVSTAPGPNGGSGIVILRYSGTNVLASGGTISTASNYVYHTFTASSVLTFVDGALGAVTGAGTISSPIKYLLIGGGGSGGTPNSVNGGGGGAGGLITGTFTITNINNLLTITVGSGGSNANGGNSSIIGNYVTKIAYGGGRGGNGSDFGGNGTTAGSAGGSGGGGGAQYASTGQPGGAATQPSSIYGGYGNAGGSGGNSGGGGGAASNGAGVYIAGLGLFINTPSSSYSKGYAVGGPGNTGAATAYTGNGGGGAGGTGGSGIAILWEPAVNTMPTLLGNPTIITTSGYRVYVYNSSGGIVFNPSLSNNLVTDSSANSYTASPSNSPTQGSFNPYSANSSMYFNGSSNLVIPNSASYGTTGLSLSSGDFTIEGWVYFNDISSGQLIGHAGSAWKIQISSSGILAYYLSSNGSTFNIANAVSIGSVSAGRWYHFALLRSGSTFTSYLNGVAGTPTTNASSLYAYTNSLTIGNVDGYYLNGYLSNIRILKGTAYYTSSFTPAIAPLPIVSNTLLLTCAGSNLIDKSSYNWTINQSGIPVVKKFSPFANVGAYNTTLVGGSAYFNGSSDWIAINSTSTINTLTPNWTYLHDGTTDYTIEGWIYPLTTATTFQTLIGTSDAFSTSVPGMQLKMYGNSFYWTLINGSGFFNIAGGNFQPNAWSHIACTFVSSNKTVNLYLNGARVTTNAITTATFTATSASYPLTIGKSAVSATPYYYSGYMSNLRVLKGVISDGVATTNVSIGTTFEYLIVAGGGGNAGGGGGFRTGTVITTQSGVIYAITVGNGGSSGVSGGNSSLVGGGINIVSAGGGAGGVAGGSGGSGAAGNTPATSPAQGYDGSGGGGGGAGVSSGLNGGPGAYSNIDGLGYYYSGGGGGNGGGGGGGNGGIGGGGYGTGFTFGSPGAGGRNAATTAGGTNTGGGGSPGNAGGSGCVIIRYLGPQRAVGGNVTTNISGYTVHTFLASGTLVDNIQTYTIPTAPVVADSTTTNLLLNFTNAKIVDASLNIDMSTSGDTGLVSDVKKYNNMSMFFDGASDIISLSTNTSVSLGGGDFTVEMWMYPTTVYNTGNAPALLDARTSADGAGLVRLGYNGVTLPNGGVIGWKENTSYVVTATVTTNAWNHVAVVRRSGIMYMYVNGVVSNNTASNTTGYTSPFITVGGSYDNLCWNGYMDDLRITNGIARYTSTFTAPTYKPQLK